MPEANQHLKVLKTNLSQSRLFWHSKVIHSLAWHEQATWKLFELPFSSPSRPKRQHFSAFNRYYVRDHTLRRCLWRRYDHTKAERPAGWDTKLTDVRYPIKNSEYDQTRHWDYWWRELVQDDCWTVPWDYERADTNSCKSWGERSWGIWSVWRVDSCTVSSQRTYFCSWDANPQLDSQSANSCLRRVCKRDLKDYIKELAHL